MKVAKKEKKVANTIVWVQSWVFFVWSGVPNTHFQKTFKHFNMAESKRLTESVNLIHNRLV